jgi:hypothetical protein
MWTCSPLTTVLFLLTVCRILISLSSFRDFNATD